MCFDVYEHETWDEKINVMLGEGNVLIVRTQAETPSDSRERTEPRSVPYPACRDSPAEPNPTPPHPPTL